jgi:hypothetical protein
MDARLVDLTMRYYAVVVGLYKVNAVDPYSSCL